MRNNRGRKRKMCILNTMSRNHYVFKKKHTRLWKFEREKDEK